ncbi:MAG: type II toxin-antitoxin system PemK/MazF family toxin [Coriobacteriia bacterium]|nr:type II toxin-antitoxin system PemK/MazF family toxin [Coriobacteriia bacterium]
MVTLKRGDVLRIDFEPVIGCEQGGVRPALVVQNDVGNRYSRTTIVAAITTKAPSRAFPFMVELPEGTLPRSSFVDCAQIRTIDLSRVTAQPMAHVDRVTMLRVDDALAASFGL